MRIEFSPEAKLEFEDGERYYERQVPGLGAQFRADVRNALVRFATGRWPRRSNVETSGA